ncbi:MAG: WYL domain-containing protein [Eubacteriales bacterium]|nr:WYL domain-containing protein [Eubacteriales bacterium]
MPRSFRQKIKILYLMKAFLERTDEQHPMQVKELLAYLEDFGIQAERKTIYDDIENLRVFGLDIVSRREKPSGFYLASREFEVAELKLLVDAVQSCRFITQSKSTELIHKLEGLASVHQAKELQRQVLVDHRVKAVNESVYYNIDEIHRGICGDRQISFQYYEWTVSKEMRLKRDGERYRISPWKLIWKDENYYLVGLDERSGIVKHYRVDKMRKISVEETFRNGKEIFDQLDPAEFLTGTFGMFGGRMETVSLLFENRLAGVAIDHFGQEIMLMGQDEGHFVTRVRVQVSSPFFGWLAGLGAGVAIQSPESVRREYRDFLKKALTNYEG